MKLVYASRMGHVESVVNQLGVTDVLKILTGDEMVNEPFVLFTYTDKVGEIPSIVSKFLENNHKNLVAVIGSGSMERHAETFNFGAKKVSEKYGVELVRCIDLSGTSEDVKAIKEFLNQ